MSSSSTSAPYHGSHYYVRHVRESLSTRVSKAICCCFLCLLLLVGLLLFILWLSLRPHRPRFHLASFSALSILSQSSNDSTSFNVARRNPNQNVGIFYDHSGASLFYGEERIGATPLLFPFYQPPKNTTSFSGAFSGGALAVSERTWKLFRKDVDERGTVVFRLELRSKIRFRVSTWYNSWKSHVLHVSCHVEVGPDGQMLPSLKGKRCSLYFF